MPTCFNRGMCWTKKKKEPPGICGVVEMQGTICGGVGRWMLLLLGALIFTFTNFVTVIMDFPVNVMENNHLRAHHLLFGFGAIDGDMSRLEISFFI